jgi:hypothetical protein
MKRSQAIELLGNLINSKLPQDYVFSIEEVSDILLELEEAGMLPPISKLEALNTYDNAWEPENS